jgi:hypothetical protein
VILGLFFIAGMGLAEKAAAFDHGAWDGLLEEHVEWRRDGVTSVVDYSGLADDEDTLDAYLAKLSEVDTDTFESLDRDHRLAFLINAYNAFTVKLILKQDDRPASIRDIGSIFSGPWSQRFFTLLGKQRTLDEVEHQMIRGNPELMDPRIHFAVNCASVGCPALRPEAYVGDRLDQQLADSTRRFLSDRQRNRYDEKSGVLLVSSIFDWYRKDFVNAAGSLAGYLAGHADALGLQNPVRENLQAGDVPIRFLDYDWNLNTEANTR